MILWWLKSGIFFHFDIDRFFKKGILRPIDETFIGATAYNENELLNKLEESIHNNFVNSDVDFSEMFDHIDHKNSERVYYSILNKIKKM